MENSGKQTEGERLKTVLDLLHTNPNRLAKTIGATPASIYHIIAGRNSISQNLLEKIIKNFGTVNYTFLRHGKGNPLIQSKKELESQTELFEPIPKEDIFERRETQLRSQRIQNYSQESPLEISLNFHQVQELIYQQRKTNDLLKLLIEEVKK